MKEAPDVGLFLYGVFYFKTSFYVFKVHFSKNSNESRDLIGFFSQMGMTAITN